MRKASILVGAMALGSMLLFGTAPRFEPPRVVEPAREITQVRRLEFDKLLAEQTRFEDLAHAGYYTIIEGYTDSCGACRALEKQLPQLLSARGDVLLRRVRFSEHGGRQFQAGNEASLRAQMEAYAEELASYRSFNVETGEDGPRIGTCGTPHVEIYGPDGRLLVGDSCDDQRVRKAGLGFLRRWLVAPTPS